MLKKRLEKFSALLLDNVRGSAQKIRSALLECRESDVRKWLKESDSPFSHHPEAYIQMQQDLKKELTPFVSLCKFMAKNCNCKSQVDKVRDIGGGISFYD